MKAGKVEQADGKGWGIRARKGTRLSDMKHRIHLLALPNVQTTTAYSLCGFCTATINFAKLLKSLGYYVILYASEQNEAPCDELVTVITKEEQESLLSNTRNAKGELEPTPYQYAYIEEWSPIWQLANSRMIKEISRRKQPRDFICSIGGASQKSVADAHRDLMFVEYSIGYSGSFSRYRVFESHAWRHHTYGAQGVPDGNFFDDVIPCFYDPTLFPYRCRGEKNNYALYVGRLTPRKGIAIACRAAELAGVPLKIIGHGDESLVTHGAEYLGALSDSKRNEVMAMAGVVITPTMYIEPFCQVAVEAQLCGTPVVATNWGGFTETIEEGKTGFRCNYLGEFARALLQARNLDTLYIRKRALRRYSIESVREQYNRYFNRLSLLWDKGWDSP